MNQLSKHYTATAFILTDGQPRKVLLLHHNKFGHWMPPGGHQEPNENPVEAVIREVREETGLDITTLLPNVSTEDRDTHFIAKPWKVLEVRMDARPGDPEHYHIDQQYLVIMPEQPVVPENPSRGEIGWFTLQEALAMPSFANVHTSLQEAFAA